MIRISTFSTHHNTKHYYTYTSFLIVLILIIISESYDLVSKKYQEISADPLCKIPFITMISPKVLH